MEQRNAKNFYNATNSPLCGAPSCPSNKDHPARTIATPSGRPTDALLSNVSRKSAWAWEQTTQSRREFGRISTGIAVANFDRVCAGPAVATRWLPAGCLVSSLDATGPRTAFPPDADARGHAVKLKNLYAPARRRRSRTLARAIGRRRAARGCVPTAGLGAHRLGRPDASPEGLSHSRRRSRRHDHPAAAARSILLMRDRLGTGTTGSSTRSRSSRTTSSATAPRPR